MSIALIGHCILWVEVLVNIQGQVVRALITLLISIQGQVASECN